MEYTDFVIESFRAAPNPKSDPEKGMVGSFVLMVAFAISSLGLVATIIFAWIAGLFFLLHLGRFLFALAVTG